MELIKIYQNWK